MMTVQQREPSCFMTLPAGGTAAAAVLRPAAAACLLAPSALSFGFPLPACPMVRCLPAEDTPSTPSAASPAAVDRSSPPPPVDTPNVHLERRPTSRFDALFIAAQQELGSVRPPSVHSTRPTSSPAAAKRTQQGASSSSSSGGSGGSRRTRPAKAAAPSRLASVSGGCTKPHRSSERAARRQAALQAKQKPQLAALAHAQRQPAAVFVNPRSADRLRRLIVMRALVSALLQAPASAPASCHVQHVASKLAPLLPAGQRPEEQRQLDEARRFLQLF